MPGDQRLLESRPRPRVLMASSGLTCMCAGMCVDKCIDMCADMCIDMWIDMCGNGLVCPCETGMGEGCQLRLDGTAHSSSVAEAYIVMAYIVMAYGPFVECRRGLRVGVLVWPDLDDLLPLQYPVGGNMC